MNYCPRYIHILMLLIAGFWLTAHGSRFPARVTTDAAALGLEEVERGFEPRPAAPTLTINPEDRIKLRQSLMEVAKRRRVTATTATMSPDVISTPNVYHFFSKKRFDRVRNTTKTTTTNSPIPVTTLPSNKLNQAVEPDYGLV